MKEKGTAYVESDIAKKKKVSFLLKTNSKKIMWVGNALEHVSL